MTYVVILNDKRYVYNLNKERLKCYVYADFTKCAYEKILDSINNSRVGLMR